MKPLFPARNREGFSLVEVTLALAVVAFLLSVLTGLLWLGLSENKTASSQTAATSLLTAVISDLHATPAATPPGSVAVTSPLYQINIPAEPITTAPAPIKLYLNSDGEIVSSAQGSNTYLVTVAFLVNAATAPSRSATWVDLKVSWPAAAPVANAMGSVETFVALDRN
jgi:uncharacterized protein (TIGR02598 family)